MSDRSDRRRTEKEGDISITVVSKTPTLYLPQSSEHSFFEKREAGFHELFDLDRESNVLFPHTGRQTTTTTKNCGWSQRECLNVWNKHKWQQSLVSMLQKDWSVLRCDLHVLCSSLFCKKAELSTPQSIALMPVHFVTSVTQLRQA